MPNYNPYQYMGASGYGSSPAGYGQNWSYGQQRSNNPYQQMQQGSQNYQQSQGNNFYYPGGQSAPTGQLNYNPYQQQPQGRFPGSSNQFLSPTQGGKGRGFGGWGGPNSGAIGQQQQQQLYQQQYGQRSPQGKQTYLMGQYEQLLKQRQLEEALGLGQSAPGWNPNSYLASHGYPTQSGQSYGYPNPEQTPPGGGF